MRISRRIFAALLLVAGLSIIAFVISQSATYRECASNKQTQAGEQQKNKSHSALVVYIDCIGTFTHENHGPITAVFTVLLGFATIFLWLATRDLVASAEQTARRQLRAYIFIKSSNIVEFPTGSKIVIGFDMENYGQTPAYDVFCRAHVFLDDWPTTKNFLLEVDQRNAIGDIGPTGIFNSTSTFRKLTPHEIAAVAAKKMAIYIQGIVTYRDAFGRSQKIEFRRFKGGPAGIDGEGMAIDSTFQNKSKNA